MFERSFFSHRNLIDEARLAMQGVVRIYARGFDETDPRSYLDPSFISLEEWVASGFFITMQGKEGYILTNSHVVRNALSVEIKSLLTSDELFKTEVVGLVSDLEPDVAILKLPEDEIQRFLAISDRKSLPNLKISFTKNIERGEEVKVIGSPLGMDEPNISGGEISNFISGTEEGSEHMVTDAAINPGNSGGPALIQGGWVVGINTAKAVPAENIGFVTPLSLVEHVLEDLLNNRETKICRLGALLQKNSEQIARHLGMSEATGVLVRHIYKGSLAEKLGLKSHDVVLSINEFEIDRYGNVPSGNSSRKRNLHDVLHSCAQGENLIFRVFRKDQELELKGVAHASEKNDFPIRPLIAGRKFISFAGMVIQEVSDEIVLSLVSFNGLKKEYLYRDYNTGHSLILTHIYKGTHGWELGLDVGDFIKSVNGQAVHNLGDFENALRTVRDSGELTMVIRFLSGGLACLETKTLSKEELQIRSFTAPSFV